MTTDLFRIRDFVPDFDAINASLDEKSAATRARHRHIADIAYGEEPRQRLDLFFPEDMEAPCPVHVFLHGGYWRAYDRRSFHCVAESVIAAGAIAVIAEYTLMPGARMAQLVGEVRQALEWVGENIGAHGGSVDELSASGHSAGAHLASYLFSASPGEALPTRPPRSMLLLSGIYDLEPIRTSFLKDEIALTAEEVAAWTPLQAAPAVGTSVTLAVGADETAPFHQQAADYDRRLSEAGLTSEVMTLEGLNHMSIVAELGQPGTPAASLLARTIARSRR